MPMYQTRGRPLKDFGPHLKNKIADAMEIAASAGAETAGRYIGTASRGGLKNPVSRNPSYPSGRVRSTDMLKAWSVPGEVSIRGDTIVMDVGPENGPDYFYYQEAGFEHIGKTGGHVPGMFAGRRVLRRMRDVFRREYGK